MKNDHACNRCGRHTKAPIVYRKKTGKKFTLCRKCDAELIGKQHKATA